MVIFLTWLGLAVIVGVAANSRGRFGFGWFLLAVVISPLLAGLLVLALPSRAEPKYYVASGAGRIRVVSEPPAESAKRCGFCAEDIKRDAIVCRYCGRDQPTDAAPIIAAQAENLPSPLKPAGYLSTPSHSKRPARGGAVVGVILGALLAAALGVYQLGRGDEPKVRPSPSPPLVAAAPAVRSPDPAPPVQITLPVRDVAVPLPRPRPPLRLSP